MADVRVNEETETDRGWRFDVDIREADGVERRVCVALSWHDYDLWGRGAVPPADVARALVRVLVDRGAIGSLGESFDASSARRLVRTLDADVPEALTTG